MKTLERKIKLEDTSAQVDNNTLKITGPKGTIERNFREKSIEIKIEDKKVVVKALSPNRNTKRIMNTTKAHIQNMVKGVKEGYEYRLKICSGHFPMNVAIQGKDITIKNFIGEKNPRKYKVKGDVELKMNKELITVTGIDKEVVGQAAANIEKLTRIREKDRRIFMDGIYIISKDKND